MTVRIMGRKRRVDMADQRTQRLADRAEGEISAQPVWYCASKFKGTQAFADVADPLAQCRLVELQQMADLGMRLAIESEQKGGSEAGRQALQMVGEVIRLGRFTGLRLPKYEDALPLPSPDCRSRHEGAAMAQHAAQPTQVLRLGKILPACGDRGEERVLKKVFRLVRPPAEASRLVEKLSELSGLHDVPHSPVMVADPG